MVNTQLTPTGVPAQVPATANPPQAKAAPALTSRDLIKDHEPDAFFFRELERSGILLNAPQIKAVRHGEGPLLILAGAGCGKTTVLAARTAYLLAVRGVPASSILLVTFTSKAAREIKERIARMPGVSPASARAVEARTFHSFALLLLRKSGCKEQILGDSGAQHTIMKMLLRRLDPSQTFQPETLLAALSAWKMQGRSVDELPDQTSDEAAVKAVLEGYEAWKEERCLWDFDDILLQLRRRMDDRIFLKRLQNRYTWLMVDEFQDTNTIQYELVQYLAAAHRNLAVVGDDDQTIYTFNGARQELILEFDKLYPECRIVTLDINYRSDSRIIGLGSAMVRHNRFRRDKELKAAGPAGQMPKYVEPSHPEEEAEWVVSHITRQVQSGKASYKNIAILHRTAGSSRAVLEQLLLRDIPFVQYGSTTVFYDQPLVKPLMDHLRLSLNPRRMESLHGALGPLYVSKEEGLAFILAQEKETRKKYPLIHLTRWSKLQPFQQTAVKERIKLIKSLQKMKPTYALQEMRRVFYDKYVQAGDPLVYTQYKEMVLDSLEELESAAARFNTVEQFVAYADDLSLRHAQMEELKDEHGGDAVQLMTIHRAKGLEFPYVYWIGASEGILPHSTALKEKPPEELKATRPDVAEQQVHEAALEEERRLAYVAVTRAKERLYISSPAYYHGKPAPPSRFLLEAYGIKRSKDSSSRPAKSAHDSRKTGGYAKGR
ncbi:ATP-dependent helicase [Paenibacillus sp.]|jgi:DNA helicase-2/ATP-dependent DNA helicase PcrA|uniref:ATP-dependent helicase n=1 Tax=Paenibacillus sp. TaxID=58172 RepID=UPI00282554C9|nr:ATP-dependent helicase [Paenibacillus sp.]MDR0269220.1 ATP-dependent helicase [Paenibacillus sp.]